ncbi:MAG: aspartate kinase [Planctomycetes bacterium]|nr:aspartate kinase [Planctomycetota bacterium]
MSLIVQKYGGTSVATPGHIRRVAERIVRQKEKYSQVMAVISAMGKSTDDLVRLSKEVCTGAPDRREMDMLLTAGERIAMALVAMAINDLGHKARSFTGSQVGIITDGVHQNAKIKEIRGGRIREALSEGTIAIVAGFQGFGEHREITTLGRGGSDTTAVALAACFNADVCEILTDVPAMLTADPRIVKDARPIRYASYDEMLEMAYAGAKMHPRAIEIAYRYRIPLHIRSSFTEEPGTLIGGTNMEKVVIRAVASSDKVAKVVVRGVPNQPGVAAKIFSHVGGQNIHVKYVVQSQNYKGRNDVAFIIDANDLAAMEGISETLRDNLSAREVICEQNVGTITVIGEGIASSTEVIGGVFKILADIDVNIDMISSSTTAVTAVIPKDRLADAVLALHSNLDLDQPLED